MGAAALAAPFLQRRCMYAEADVVCHWFSGSMHFLRLYLISGAALVLRHLAGAGDSFLHSQQKEWYIFYLARNLHYISGHESQYQMIKIISNKNYQ